MPTTKARSSADALNGLWTLALTTFIIAALYFGRDLLIPLALAALLTFLLAPLVTRLERWLGRIAAVLVVVALIFTAMGTGGYVLTRQLVDLATRLPDYKDNIQTKLRTFQLPKGGAFSKFSATIEELRKDLPGAQAAPVVTQKQGQPETAKVAPANVAPPITPVEVVESSRSNPMAIAESLIAPILGPLGTGALVLLLVICMLLQREDLRNRIIRLIGQGRISTTTKAMDDAGSRVSRYLLMQLVVNVSYGVPVAIGLFFIGVPNAILWGGFATVLRFIPYIGPWIAASIPVILSMAVTTTWWTPILTIGLFIVLELLSNNIMEPLLYGSSTGVTSIALIVAAVFWTWLWGPVGLVMATPLTVCLVVMGRHIPRLSFLSIVLSDEEALTPAEDCYHRMLTVGDTDELEFIESYLKANSLTALYDAVLVPVISLAETDHRLGNLDDEQRGQVEQSLRDVIEDFGSRSPVASKIAADVAIAEHISPPRPAPACRVYVLPAQANRDELAGKMLVQLLVQQNFTAFNAPGKLVAGELIGLVEKSDVDVVCVSVVAPSTVIHARYLCTKLRAAFPKMKIVVGLWGATERLAEAAKSLRSSGVDEVVTTLADAVVQLAKLAPQFLEVMVPSPIPADEEARLAALDAMHLLDAQRDPHYDRMTQKLARLFEVPIVLISLVDRERQVFYSQVGLPADLATAGETPRNVSVCGHVVANNELLVVEDLARDRRFANNPLILERGLRFYAGAPLRAPGGQPIGSLCLLDTKPRPFSDREKRMLLEYATEVTEKMMPPALEPTVAG